MIEKIQATSFLFLVLSYLIVVNTDLKDLSAWFMGIVLAIGSFSLGCAVLTTLHIIWF